MAQQEEPRTLLHALALARSLTYAEAAKEYRRIGRQIGEELGDDSYRTADVSEPTWRRWTGGKQRRPPNPPAPRILERLFGASVLDLLGPPTRAAVTSQPLIDESDIAMTARDAAAHAGHAASAHLPDMTLDQVEDDVQALAVDYETTDPVAAFRRAEDLLLDVQDKLERTQRPRQQERLYLAAGQTGALLSVASFDLAMLGPAVQFARTAVMYGQTIEHGPLQAYAHGVLAYLAYWDGRPTAALRNIQIAKSFTGVGDMGRVRLAAIEARAQAHLGRSREAERSVQAALGAGTDLRDELHDAVGGEFSFGPARAAMSHASTYLVLGDWQRAEDSAAHALRLLADDPNADRPVQMQVTVDLARARLLRGELDGADDALAPVFATAVEWRTIGLVDRVARLRAQLVRPEVASAVAARSLGERIEDFVACAAARPLPGSRLVIES
jgi:tetratricopeptide (TPR) repeat protein